MHRAKVTYRAFGVGLVGAGLALTSVALGRLALHDAPALSHTGLLQPANVLTVLAEGVGAIVAAWLALGISLALLAAVSGLRLPAILLPRSLTRLIGAALGVSVVVGAAVPAGAATPGPTSATTSMSASLDPGWVPSQSATVTSAVPAPAPQHPPKAPTQQHHRADRSVTVHRGDTLWSIAHRQAQAQENGRPTVSQVAALWPRWFATNRAAIGPDPDVLRPGTRLQPPPGQ